MKFTIRKDENGVLELFCHKTNDVVLRGNRARLLSDYAFDELGAQQVIWEEGVPWE